MEWSCYSNAGTRCLVHYQQPGLVASSTTSSRDSLPRPLPGSETGYRSLDKNTYLVAVGGCLTTVIS